MVIIAVKAISIHNNCNHDFVTVLIFSDVEVGSVLLNYKKYGNAEEQTGVVSMERKLTKSQRKLNSRMAASSSTGRMISYPTLDKALQSSTRMRQESRNQNKYTPEKRIHIHTWKIKYILQWTS